MPEQEPRPVKEKISFKEYVCRAVVTVGLGTAALWFVGNHLADKVNSEGIKPAIEKEGDQLELAVNQAVSKEDVETVIKVGCGLHSQFVLPTEDPNDLTELCREYLPEPEEVPEDFLGQPVEVAQDTTYFVTTTTTQP